MKQTAVEWLIQQLVELDKQLDGRRKNDDATVIKLNPTKIFEQAKEMEKQQIIDAYKYGDLDLRSADTYYNETYGSKGSKIGSSLEWNGEVTQGHGVPASSQTEISDEEIQKAAESQATFAPSFVRGVEWYREQLKQRQ